MQLEALPSIAVAFLVVIPEGNLPLSSFDPVVILSATKDPCIFCFQRLSQRGFSP